MAIESFKPEEKPAEKPSFHALLKENRRERDAFFKERRLVYGTWVYHNPNPPKNQQQP